MEMAATAHTFQEAPTEARQLKQHDTPKDEPTEEKKLSHVSNDRYEFQNYNEKKRYILKIRASGNNCLVSSNWGEWSEPIEFGKTMIFFSTITLFASLSSSQSQK
ncbi:hypothetical protein EK904_003712 [Melospiza melodia maxima]|nr:hypothetical protein EK904_003712 [Melospiza melodia maxima]